jgi:hypothetical protein
MTAYPEVIPKKCGSVRIDDNPTGTLEHVVFLSDLWLVPNFDLQCDERILDWR